MGEGGERQEKREEGQGSGDGEEVEEVGLLKHIPLTNSERCKIWRQRNKDKYVRSEKMRKEKKLEFQLKYPDQAAMVRKKIAVQQKLQKWYREGRSRRKKEKCWIKDPSPERDEYFYLTGSKLPSKPPFTCLSCHYTSPYKSDVKRHYTMKHINEKLYRCVQCDKSFSGTSHFNYHWRREHEKDVFLKYCCHQCGKGYITNGDMKRHMDTHNVEDHPCQFCDRKYKTIKRKEGHEKRHMNSNIACDVCGKILASAKGAVEHRSVHDENDKINKLLECDLCGKTLKSRSMKTHKEMHAREGTVKKHLCHICDSKFHMKRNLMRHINITHMNRETLQCPYCNSKLSSSYKFKRHSKRYHGGRKLPMELHKTKYSALTKIICETVEPNTFKVNTLIVMQ